MDRKDIDEIAEMYAAVFHNLQTKGGFKTKSQLIPIYAGQSPGVKVTRPIFSTQHYFSYYRVVKKPNASENEGQTEVEDGDENDESDDSSEH